MHCGSRCTCLVPSRGQSGGVSQAAATGLGISIFNLATRMEGIPRDANTEVRLNDLTSSQSQASSLKPPLRIGIRS